jgi:hypothetical protein
MTIGMIDFSNPRDICIAAAAITSGTVVAVFAYKGFIDFKKIVTDNLEVSLKSRNWEASHIEWAKWLTPIGLLVTIRVVAIIAYFKFGLSAALATLGVMAVPFVLNGMKAYYDEYQTDQQLMKKASSQT